MVVEKYANEAETTLATAINNSIATIVVASSTGFPAVTTALRQQFRIRVEPAVPDGSHEWMIVTNITGVTWNVTRGAEGSAAQAWPVGARITAVMTAGNVFPKGAADLTFTHLDTDYFADIEIQDDGTPSGGWRDRLRIYFKLPALTRQLVQWWNEFGELRLMPALDNTVALRIFVKNLPTDDDHTGFVFEIADNRTDRNPIAGFDGEGNVIAVNLGIQVDSGLTPPTDLTRGWINTNPAP